MRVLDFSSALFDTISKINLDISANCEEEETATIQNTRIFWIISLLFGGYYARVYQGQVKPRCDADKGNYFEKLFSDKKNHCKVEVLQAMTKDNLWMPAANLRK